MVVLGSCWRAGGSGQWLARCYGTADQNPTDFLHALFARELRQNPTDLFSRSLGATFFCKSSALSLHVAVDDEGKREHRITLNFTSVFSIIPNNDRHQ
jgi:hypothetical protein